MVPERCQLRQLRIGHKGAAGLRCPPSRLSFSVRRFTFMFVFALGPALARADVLPEPERPSEWNEHPPPPPPPPPEKDLTRALWPMGILAAAVGLGSLRGRRRVSPA